MPFNGSGTFTRVMDWTNDRDAQIKIRADRHDQNDDDIAAGLSQTITRDGQSQITANIPFNGKRITTLANPVDPQDGVTKSYADAIRSFATPIIITGNDAQGRLRFTGAQTDATATSLNPIGIEFAQSDLFFGVKRYTSEAAPNRFVWNPNADGSGVDLMTLWETGALTLGGVGATSILQTPKAAIVSFRKRDAATGKWYWNITDTGLVGGANDVSIASLDDAGNFYSAGRHISNNGIFAGGGIAAIIAPSSVGNVYVRPQTFNSTLNESIFYSNGQVSLSAPVYSSGVPMALVSPATANTTTSFPIGTTLQCGANTGLVRQALYGVFLEGSGGGASYIANGTPAGWTPGTQLSGNWVCRGGVIVPNHYTGSGTIFLCEMQRVS